MASASSVMPCSKAGHEVFAHGASIQATMEQESARSVRVGLWPTLLANSKGKHHRSNFVKVGKQSDGRVRG